MITTLTIEHQRRVQELEERLRDSKTITDWLRDENHGLKNDLASMRDILHSEREERNREVQVRRLFLARLLLC